MKRPVLCSKSRAFLFVSPLCGQVSEPSLKAAGIDRNNATKPTKMSESHPEMSRFRLLKDQWRIEKSVFNPIRSLKKFRQDFEDAG